MTRHYHPRESDELRLTLAVEALDDAALQALYDALPPSGNSALDTEQVDEWNRTSIRSRVLGNLFEGTYTLEQLAPYLPVP